MHSYLYMKKVAEIFCDFPTVMLICVSYTTRKCKRYHQYDVIYIEMLTHNTFLSKEFYL